MKNNLDIIIYEEHKTLYSLFLERVKRSPQKEAYRYFNRKNKAWESYTWAEAKTNIEKWVRSFKKENIQKGDFIALWLNSSPNWVFADMACQAIGAVSVPLYSNDRPENVSYILNDTKAKILIVQDAKQYKSLINCNGNAKDRGDVCCEISSVNTILSVNDFDAKINGTFDDDLRLKFLSKWLSHYNEKDDFHEKSMTEQDLASVVYTSGTTGKPKGVMLSHANMMWNAYAGLQHIPVTTDDVFLSFLPLSHTFERTVGYYVPIMAGATVVYSRSRAQLSEDLQLIKPTIMISVPRLFEKILAKINEVVEKKSFISRLIFNLFVKTGYKMFLYRQGKSSFTPSLLLYPLLFKIVGSQLSEKLGGKLRLTISGGAALSPEVSYFFLSLGLNLVQGYGMTELSPVVSVNKIEDNIPDSVGSPLNKVEIKITKDKELLVKSPGVMLGYLNNIDATKKILNGDGFLHTGDKVEFIDNHIYIKGRIKEIIVLSNGEKFPPVTIEQALETDIAIEQAMVIGEGKPFLSALIVLTNKYKKYLQDEFNTEDLILNKNIENILLDKIRKDMHSMPGAANIYRVAVIDEEFTTENGLLTPTMKLKREPIKEKYSEIIKELYKGH